MQKIFKRHRTADARTLRNFFKRFEEWLGFRVLKGLVDQTLGGEISNRLGRDDLGRIAAPTGHTPHLRVR